VGLELTVCTHLDLPHAAIDEQIQLQCLDSVFRATSIALTTVRCLSISSGNYRQFRSLSKMAQRMSLDETILSADVLTTLIIAAPVRVRAASLS
jgi:hypothetical protein